ncbi:uncharacterized protein LOC107227239 [Neodiprion lecontei]|uniref:Uncharacterized protein LOC107227239 n=1 Tax=Neodiprion lecontei TaxID=441921 RepID=A0A6J0CB69_NEOLC|nr:uncharacterized protein LOC107227239 [Neodiprion lecontei]
MAESKIKLEFDASEDHLETFTERSELYFIASGITDAEKQKAVMLTKISRKTYTLIRDSCAPQKPKDKTFEELQLMIKNHLCPQPSEAVERGKFHQAAQLTTESVSEFVAWLRKLAIYCNIQDLSAALRDQLVCGLRQEESRVLSFREKKLTFDKAYKIAVRQEKAKADANIRVIFLFRKMRSRREFHKEKEKGQERRSNEAAYPEYWK